MFDLTKPRRFVLNVENEFHATSSSLEYLKACIKYGAAGKSWAIIETETQKVVDSYEAFRTTATGI